MSGGGIVIAGTHSGSGKTTVTLGIMAALRQLGRRVMPFKCGPDFIDPTLHHLVTGEISRNLDLWMAGESFCQTCYSRWSSPADISVVEGVMGMFDGGASSSAALAKALGLPVILVLDVRSAAESGAAMLKGFEVLDPQIRPSGVILNMVGSRRHHELVATAIIEHCRAEVLGSLPRTLDFTLPSRHLGLHMGEETPVTPEKIEAFARVIGDNIDLRRLEEIAASATAPHSEHAAKQKDVEGRIRLAVARDRAFCFYYEDNLDILRRAGAEICFFSPLDDKALPENIDGVYLGGGYPELYADRLSSNEAMLTAIRKWTADDRPLYAECGGFMYLTRGITDQEGRFHDLAGVFPTQAVMQTKRARLGYRQITTTTESFFGPPRTQLRGHEFHYSSIEEMKSDIERIYAVGDTVEGYRLGNVLGGYMHLHFGSTPEAAGNFVRFCLDHRKERNQ